MPPEGAPFWEPWLGLPHEIGADPREGRAACCLVIAQVVLQRAGLPFPPIDPLLEAVRRGDWIELQKTFYSHCTALDAPEINALCLIRNGPQGLGIGTVVASNTLITLHHHKGVITLPANRLRLLKFYKLRE